MNVFRQSFTAAMIYLDRPSFEDARASLTLQAQ